MKKQKKKVGLKKYLGERLNLAGPMRYVTPLIAMVLTVTIGVHVIHQSYAATSPTEIASGFIGECLGDPNSSTAQGTHMIIWF